MEGAIGQQQKAYSMLTSRKIVSVKSFSQSGEISFVKAQIKKPFGDQICPATILFQDSIPFKAYCEFPVGVTGLYCHTLALLLFLNKYYAEAKKKLALSCTEHLQKWHRRSKKGYLSMMLYCEIRVNSPHSKMRLVHGTKIVPVDPEKTFY